MANKKTTMTDLRIIIRYLKQGMSELAISQKAKLSRSSIRVYKERLKAASLDYDQALALDDAKLGAVLTKEARGRTQDDRMKELEPLLEGYAQDHRIKYRGYDVIWGDYIKTHPGGYSYNRFRQLLSEWEKRHSYSYHNVRIPGDEMQVDFAGDGLWIADRKTGERTKVVVLCCLLTCSSLSFVYALPSAVMEWLFYGLSLALEYFGGVPARVLSDNMKQWVKRADKYEPEYTDTAKEWSLHYGCELDAARVKKPRDKGAVESLVYQAYRYIYARLAKETFYSIEELNSRIAELLDEFNSRQMSGRPYSRLERFQQLEKEHLMPLPPQRFAYKHKKAFKLSSTYHVVIAPEQRIYSVPYQYVGKECVAIYDNDTVEVYCGLERIALHKRVHMAGESTEPAHMPPNHREWERSKACNAEMFNRMSEAIGPHTHRVVLSILGSKPFVCQTYKSCHGIMSLGRKYGHIRLEAACKRTEGSPVVNYGIIKSILEKGLDQEPAPQPSTEAYIPENHNVRGASAYQ